MKMQGLLNEVLWDSSISARLLIVVDDAFLRTTLCQQLAGEGFNEVFEASTLLEVFEKLPDANPDLILLDVCLPDGNGQGSERSFGDKLSLGPAAPPGVAGIGGAYRASRSHYGLGVQAELARYQRY